MGVVDRGILWKARIKNWLPVCAWAGLIFYFSTDHFSSDNTSELFEFVLSWLWPEFSSRAIAPVHGVIRKLGHWIAYFVLAVLMLRALLYETGKRWESRHAILTFVLILVYALSDEGHQSFVPSRTASSGDVFIDLLGGICGIFWMYGYRKGILAPLSLRTHQD